MDRGIFDREPKPETDRQPPQPATPKIVQLQAWHDQLLGLTDTGEIYRLTIDQYQGIWTMVVDSVPLFGGFPRGRRR